MQKVKFSIQGMTCSSCQAHVEKTVSKLQGIKNVNVNLLSNTMSVEYDEDIINNEKIIKAVVDAGYGANIYEEKNENKKTKEENNSKTKDNIKEMKQRLIISVCFLIPLMYIAMYHMLPHLSVMDKIFHGPENRNNLLIYSNIITYSNSICKQKIFFCADLKGYLNFHLIWTH